MTLKMPLPVKEPQCRHKEEFVTYTEFTIGWEAFCSNCTSRSAEGFATKEEARIDLMRIEAPPLVQP